MWKFLLIGCTVTGALMAQSQVSPIDFANLREDVRGLSQKFGDLELRVEQLERENNDLRARASTAGKDYVTLVQLNQAINDLNQTIRTEVAQSKDQTLHIVAQQMEKLANQTNAALGSLAKAESARPPVQTSFSNDYSKQGTSYTVQKGDTLASIAKKTGARLQDIINANKITDPSHIMVGQTLSIPNPPSSAK